MKCDELIPTEIYARFAEEVYDDFGDSPQEQGYYRKEHADAAIAELKQKLEDAGMRERRLKRALWLARAQRANEHYHRYHGKFLCPLEDIPEYVKWKQVESKCLKKAEEYK